MDERKELVNELYHFGVKGMKWGVRKDRNAQNRSPARKKKIIARELDKDSSLMNNYVKTYKKYGHKSSQAVTARKRVNQQGDRLRKQVIDYLGSISKQEVKNLVKFDDEHGRHYVEKKVFNKRYNDLDDGIYID